jgi:hypothetical protein
MISDETVRFWEFLAYIVTALALPAGLFAFWRELRAERENERREIQQREDYIYVELSRQYSTFLQAILAHPELGLLDETSATQTLTEDQRRNKVVYYEMLIALFEQAYILLFEEAPSDDARRRWASWADYIEWWLQKPDFRAYALTTLEGEDPGFATYLRGRLVARA